MMRGQTYIKGRQFIGGEDTLLWLLETDMKAETESETELNIFQRRN
jgi:hypothetical protein